VPTFPGVSPWLNFKDQQVSLAIDANDSYGYPIAGSAYGTISLPTSIGGLKRQ